MLLRGQENLCKTKKGSLYTVLHIQRLLKGLLVYEKGMGECKWIQFRLWSLNGNHHRSCRSSEHKRRTFADVENKLLSFIVL